MDAARAIADFARDRSRGLALLLGLVATGCASHPERETTEPVTIDFESCELGKPPAGFTTDLTGGGGPVAWIVRQEYPHAPSGEKILVQESADDTSYRFPLCLYDKAWVRDVNVEVHFKAFSGKVDQAGGIVLRYTPENYYIARANALEDNVNIFKTVNGKRTIVAEAPIKAKAGEWHTLGFAAKGNHLTVRWDGKVVLEQDDATFTGPGQVGLWTKADSVSAFDDLKIEPLH